MKLKIIHYADIQIEIRTSGQGSQRLFEFTDSLRRMEVIIEKEEPNIIVLAGDIFEFQATNGEETKLFGEHLNTIAKHCDRIVIIAGNHDIRQRGIALYDIDKTRNLSDSIDSVVSTINNPKISYYDETGFYTDKKFDIVWAVWSQRTKWNMDGSDRPYSPWELNTHPVGNIIELFHDPRQGCIGFNRQSYMHFEEYSITLDSFRANTILSGDIHAPETVWFGEENKRLFTYSSSLVMRNFGEGDYYNNTERYVMGNQQHGYNVIEYDTLTNYATKCEFKPLTPTVNRYVIKIDDNFDFDTDIAKLVLDEPAPNNIIRIECNTSIKKFTEYQGELVEHLQQTYNIDSIDFTYGADIIEVDVEEGDENLDLTELVSKDNLTNLSKKYIDSIVDSTKSIDDADKDEAKTLINSIFGEELLKINFDRTRKELSIHQLVARNFMNFGMDVVVDFDAMGRITRISGTNGLGKTTIFRAIKWILTDKLDANQNARNKRENYFAVFNDHTGLDEVFLELIFSVNKDKHFLTKTLSREWKRGKSAVGNIMADMRNTPTVTYTLNSDHLNTNNTEEVEAYLESIISFEELDRFVFVDMDTLTDLIRMPSEDLGGLILEEIGLNFVNDLLDNYDEVRDSKLDSLSKPKEDVDVLSKRLTDLKGKNELIDTELTEMKYEHQKVSEMVEKIDVKVEQTRETLHKVESVENIEDAISEFNGDMEELVLVQNQTAENLKEIQASVGNIDDLNDERIRLLGIIQSNEGGILNNEDTIVNLEQNIESKKEDAKKLLVREKENQQNKISGQEGKISKLEQEISNTNNTYQKAIQDWRNEKQAIINTQQEDVDIFRDKLVLVSDKKSKITEDISKFNYKYTSITTDSITKAEKIGDLGDESKCPTCKQDLDTEHLTHISTQVAELEESIDKNNKLLEFINTKVAELEDTLEVTNIEYESISTDIKTIRTKISTIQNSLDFDEYPETITAIKEKASIEVLDLEKQIELINDTIKSINEDIMEHVKQSADYKDILTQIMGYRDRINELKASDLVFEEAIDKHKELLSKCLNSIKVVRETNEKIELLKDKINSQKNEVVILQSKIDGKRSELKLAHLNIPILELIQRLNEGKRTRIVDIESLSKDINELDKQQYTNNTIIEQTNSDIEDARKYKVFSSSMRLYKKLLGKKGLPVYIFSHIIPMLNKKMNQLLDSVKFRLMFDKDTLALRFHDIEKGVSRSVKFTSGMENTIIGLTLVHIIRNINNHKKFDSIYIDEISGKLNSGKDLDYDAPNYQKIVSDFLIDLSKDMKVFIVDHVLELQKFDVLSVYPEKNGTANVKVFKNMNDKDLKLITSDRKAD